MVANDSGFGAIVVRRVKLHAARVRPAGVSLGSGWAARWALGLGAICALPGCAASPATQPSSASSAPSASSTTPEILTFKLSDANVHLIRSAQPVLIDAGSPSDWSALAVQLAQHRMQPCDIRWVVVTHAHQDHAGLASPLQQRCGTRVAMHQQDVPMAAAGGFDPELRYMRWMSRLVWPLVNYRYPAFVPNLTWQMAPGDAVSLQALGLAARVLSLPGHTRGTVAVVLDDGRTFAGDMVASGALGGALFAQQPSPHYFHGDAARNHRGLLALLAAGAHTFYIGHGGPLSRHSVMQALPELAAAPPSNALINPTKDTP
jgi:hydroxyacylglutathione hydrolase